MTRSAIDLFCGAGGLSLGLEEAGFKTVFAVDNDPDACQTYRSLFPNVVPSTGDIRDVDFANWKGVDLVAGGPPCQPFSTGGHRRGRHDDRDLLPDFVRAVLAMRPQAFLLENVPGLASPVHHKYLAEVLAPLTADGYSIFGPYVINAADYGVPQSRRRLFIIGATEGQFVLPDPGAGNPRAAGEVLTALPNGTPNHSKIVYAKTPDLRPNPYHGQLFNGGGRPIDLERPAPTILASAGGNKTHFIDCGGWVPPYHRHLMQGGKPRIGELPEARRLTVTECALLQSFSKPMTFCGARSSQYAQVGNAVPPRLAATLGEAVMTALNRAERLIRAPAIV
jgi:DNA (cytosine-5)-methyltransferase 1